MLRQYTVMTFTGMACTHMTYVVVTYVVAVFIVMADLDQSHTCRDHDDRRREGYLQYVITNML